MGAMIGLILAALAYALGLGVLIGTSGFTKRAGAGSSWLHFRESAIPLEQGMIGLLNLMIGLVWLALWLYFLLTRWTAFLENAAPLIPHVALQFLTGFSLAASAVATIISWKHWQATFILSLCLIFGSTLMSIYYGPLAHGGPFTMRFLGIWSFSIAALVTSAFFVLHRVLRSPRTLSSEHHPT